MLQFRQFLRPVIIYEDFASHATSLAIPGTFWYNDYSSGCARGSHLHIIDERMKSFEFVLVCICALALLGLISSCEEDPVGQNIEDIVFPDSNVSYGNHVEPLFLRGCAFSPCHDEYSLADRGYSLESYENLRRRSDIVVPGDPDGSVLIWSVEGLFQFSGQYRMPPPGYPTLNENQLKGLRKWIEDGAQNN